ncbi:hypothetical protein HSX10_13900 [Winogradskyella undariae]|uniref:hypothetical protein n=1 Tax=Winogradskyella undariae TaxID=1285465 RepID=UPI00156BB086|nr:hypothetical protein [Winogradskyella undariae]NRR92663.1 hypothetical protein [Winogradskyella undariae]
MDDFLKENYGLITSLVELFAVIVGVITYKAYKFTPVKYIIYFLAYAFFVDLIGGYPSYLKEINYFHLIEGTLIESNYWWYTLFWWIGLAFIMVFVNYKVVKTIRFKLILKYGFYIYLLQVILYIIFKFENLFISDKFISIASLWVVILSIIIYFFETLASDRIVLFYKSVYFYFNATFFIWILIIIPLLFFELYFIEDDWDYVLLKWKIHLSLNIFLYMTLSAALLFCKPKAR